MPNNSTIAQSGQPADVPSVDQDKTLDISEATIPTDIASGLVVFEVDENAEPADVLVPLARLLIDLRRKRKAREQEQAAVHLENGK